MILYLFRHAKSDPPNSKAEKDRQLTNVGRSDLRAAVPLLRRLSTRPEVVITSPRQRAIDSARLIMDGLGLLGQPKVDHRLAPGVQWPDLASALSGHREAQALAIVGHEPDLSSSIELLTGAGSVKLREGGVCRVEFMAFPAPAAGTLTLLIGPDLYSVHDGALHV